MASSKSLVFLQLFILAVLVGSSRTAADCYTSMFAFGDSMTETGNYLISSGRNSSSHVAFLPYGETFFHHPTGRYSDGRIIVDFLAEAFGLPLLRPYLGGPGGEGFSGGANFAFAGATTLDAGFFIDRGMEVFTENSLRVQLEWFKQLLSSLCSSELECRQFLQGALFMVGEIGGNDYNHPLTDGRTLNELKTYVPKVVHAMTSAVEDLIELGARTLVVPGTFPIGCMPTHLTEFQALGGSDFDQSTGCIKALNEFSEYHNHYLQQELNRVQRLNPHTTIIYADYYEPVMRIIRSPKQFDFDDAVLTACCGAGGPYNYNPSIDCGLEGSMACPDPSKHVYWDGYHLTEAAYRIVTTGILDGPYAFPPIAQTCPYTLRKRDAPQNSY